MVMGRSVVAYQNTNNNSSSFQKVVFAAVFLVACILLVENVHMYRGQQGPIMQLLRGASSMRQVKALTWNVAAINNNPFEYWITNEDASYNSIMKEVSTFIESPGANDVMVSQVFTDAMAADLMKEMKSIGWTGIEETQAKWNSEYKSRKIISEFIKDGLLGKKRLASMPDRVTNTINTVDQGVVTRPTVINCYSGDLGSVSLWWPQWVDFMFHKQITIKKKGVDTRLRAADLITTIKKSKYPAITEEEEKISLPLQTLCAAIFDAILVHMMNTIAPSKWQPLRETMCVKLNRRKMARTIEILETTYADQDIQFLQEMASSFGVEASKQRLSQLYDIYSPLDMDTDRDQNSFILLKRGSFVNVNEVTSEVLADLRAANAKAPVMNGDLLVLTAVDKLTSTRYLLASFHGDTNGLATIPVLSAVHSYALNKRSDHKLLFGMDANTYAKPEEDQQGVVEFGKFFSSKKLNSCYGQAPNPFNFTTFHARTHLQPQLNKAVKLEEKDVKGDKNPKDFILFFESDFVVRAVTKDNTGERRYVENMVFPTLAFPSDHGITSAVLLEQKSASSASSSLS